MEKNGCGHAAHALRKEKKKQAKDEFDRLKQAEKKKRRLEKALATSAAIRSELEKKKQKKIEEQKRLDEEGAAIAEAVALHVLLGEDSDDSCQIMLNNRKRSNPWACAGNIDLFMRFQSFKKYSVEGLGWVSDAYGSGSKWNDWAMGRSPGMHGRDHYNPYFEETVWGQDFATDVVAAQVVSSLQIAEDSREVSLSRTGTTAVVRDKVFEGSILGNRVNLYEEL